MAQYMPVCTERQEHNGREHALSSWLSDEEEAKRIGKEHELATRGHRFRIAARQERTPPPSSRTTPSSPIATLFDDTRAFDTFLFDNVSPSPSSLVESLVRTQVEKVLTFAVDVRIPPDGGAGGPVLIWRQDAAHEQMGGVGPYGFGANMQAQGNWEWQTTPASTSFWNTRVQAFHKRTPLNASEPWWESALQVRYHGANSLWIPDTPGYRPALLILGAEDLPYQKQVEGKRPESFGYGNFLVGIAYFPMPTPAGTVYASTSPVNREQGAPR